MSKTDDVSIAIIGSGGAGALTTGNFLLEAACAAGWYGLMTRTVGPQIRGGEAAALVRLATHPIECMPERYDLLIGIDWLNANRFGAEIDVGPHSLVISDPRGGELPAIVSRAGARIVEVPIKELAKAIPEGRANMIVLGMAAALLGLGEEALSELLAKRLADKGQSAVEASRAGLKAGLAAAADLDLGKQLSPPQAGAAKRWLVSGNETTGLGALRGGVRFAAAYPITPASEILEWLAPSFAKVGGVLLQAEDELAAVNMIIGASFGGTPALTATSGPGLSLMIEALGLATAAEIPVVVVDVMRAGPSTGIPTKSEQADLNIAIYGFHGDAPHLVLAPQSVADCLFTTQWAVHLAEALQAPAVGQPDQFLGKQSRRSTGRPTSPLSVNAPGQPRMSVPTSGMPSPEAACRRWRFPACVAANTPPMGSPTTSAEPQPAAKATIASNSTSGAPSSTNSPMATIGQRSRAKVSSRSSPGARSPAPRAKRSRAYAIGSQFAWSLRACCCRSSPSVSRPRSTA